MPAPTRRRINADGLMYSGMAHLAKLKLPDFESIQLEADHFIPLFGLSPKLGPIKEWGLDLGKEAILVDTKDYQTNVPVSLF